ncbi:unnamed protein product [Trichobilharzia szidati]|nr:unnamed protein product [Trichobilharzia szidati]
MQRFFKLETYVGKLLMSYLNKYVKLREDQFAMSIWDGDLILTQLDLRLDFLEDIIPFPVNFRSGRVHELRIHVPWTKLNSECIVISLHTVECIFGLKKRDVKRNNQNNQLPSNFADLCTYKSQSMPTNVPPGYLEVYIHRLLSSIHFVVHNLNLKFIEEDIVLSVSVNKADSFVTDSNGNPIFADINPRSTYAIHRHVQFFDLTVCLDRAGPNGYVEVYEDPIAYRFSMSCFLQVVCIPNAKSSLINQTVLTNLKIHCQTFVAHISPAQIPLLCRLIQVLLSVSTETFDWSILDSSSSDNTKSETGSSDNSCTQIGELNNETDKSDTETQSWASWVWSFVPTILPMNEDSDESDNEPTDNYTKEPQADTECLKQLIQCILEDTYEQEVATQLSVHDPSYDEASSPSNVHYTPGLSDSRSSEELGDNTSQPRIHRPSKEEYSQTRRRKIRRLRRSASMVPVFIIGIYFDKFDLNISLPSPRGFSCPSSNSGIRSRRSKRQFHHSMPAIKFELTDIAFQTTLRDVYFRLVQLGIRGFHCYPVGCVCCCGQSEYANNSQRDTVHISAVDSLSSGSANVSKCPVSKACTYDDNPDRIQPSFISLGCYPINSNSSSSSPSSSESFLHPREIFYSAVSSQQHSYSGGSDNTLHTNDKLSEFQYSPILTLSDYSKHLKDKDVRRHYPGIWFDSVCSLSLDDSHVTPSDIPSVRQHQVNGVREYIYNRCLLGSYSVEVSPSLIHRLGGLVNAYKISHPYPPCSITEEDINSASTPNEMSLSRYSQHIPMCNIQLDISAGTISVNTSHNFNRNNLSPQLQIHLENISLFSRSPVYPYDIVQLITRLNIPPYLFKRSYEFIQLELCNPTKRVDDWLQDIHSDVLNMSSNNKEWNKQLIAYCYNRTIIQFTGISVDLVRNAHVSHQSSTNAQVTSTTTTTTTATTANKSNDNVTIFKLSSLECIFWSLNCPQLWSSPSLSHLEYRLTLANTMEMYFSLQSINYLSYILGELFHQLFHLKAYCYSEDMWLSLPPVYEYQPENDSHSAAKTSWIWCTKIHGISRFRLCLTKCVSIAQISLETNLLMYLNCLNEKRRICPILERSGDKSTEHKTSMKPLFCLAVQIPYLHDLSSTAPIVCHAYLNKIDCLITRELFEWFSYLTPPNTNCEIQSYHHECNECVNNSIDESFIGMKTSDFTKKKHQLNTRSQSGSDDISSKELIKANIIASSFSAYSVISPAYSFAIGNMAQWKEVWKRLVYCEKILQNAKIQILTKHLKICTLVCQCPTTFSSFADSINHQYLEELLKQFEDISMLFNFPQLYASNYNCNTEDLTNKDQDGDDIVLSNCLWSCGLFELPMLIMLKHESNTTPQSTAIHWSISASQAYLLMENSLIFAGQMSLSLDLNHEKVNDLSLVSTSNQMTPGDKTNSMSINVRVNIELDTGHQSSYLSNENYRGVDFKVLNHMVNVVRFSYDNLSSVVIPKLLDFSTTVYKNTTSTRLLSRTSYSRNSNPSCNSKLLPITAAHSPPYTSSLNSISILEESSTDIPTIVYKSLLTHPHGKMKATRTTMNYPSPQMSSCCYSTKLKYSENDELSTSIPPFSITLHVQCSLSSVNGEINLSHSTPMNNDQPVLLHWSIDNVQLILEIQKECCSIDFRVGAFSAFIQKSTEMKIPLFTLLEKDIQPLQLLQPHINLTYNSNNEDDGGIHPKVQSNDYAKSSWFEENYIPLIPLNARKRHWLNSTRQRHEDKSNIGQYFLRIVMTRTCSKFNSTSDYYSASQSDLSVMLDNNTSCRVYTMHPENHVNISVQPLDIVIIPEVLHEITEFISNCLDYKGSLVAVDVVGDSASPESYSVKKDDICMESILTVNSLPVINATIDSFRMFYVLSGLSENKQSVKYPNALMLSCDFIQVKPLVENFIERPVWCTSDDIIPSVKQQSFASKPIVIPCDKQISLLANSINILAVPFKFMCNVKPESDYNSSVSNPIAQNPAKDWNRVASYSDIDDPLYGWSIVHSFDISVIFAPAYGKYENSESYIYGGYSMEFSIMNDLLILADCDLISYLVQLIPPVTSNCHTQKSSSSSSSPPPITRQTPQQSLLPSLFEKLLFSNDHDDCLLSTPSRLFITTRQINFLAWKSTNQGDISGKDALLAVFTSQISQPHIILNFAGTGNRNASDHFEFSMNGLQVDCRLGQLKSPCSQCKPIVINKFSEEKYQKEPCIIFIPCEIDTKVLTSSMDKVMNPIQLCSSLIFWHSDKRIVNSRTGIIQPCLSITFHRPSRSDYLSTVVNPMSSKRNRFNVCFKVGQDQTLCIRPDTLSAVLYFCKFFHELFEVNSSCLPNDEINRCRNSTDLLTSSIGSSSPSSSTARFVHLLHAYLEKINIETNSIRIKLQFDEINNKVIDSRVLEFKLKHLSTVIQLLNSTNCDTLTTSTEYLSSLSGLSLICRSVESNSLIFSKINNRGKPVYLIWPNTCLTVGGLINTKYCMHNLNHEYFTYSFDKVTSQIQFNSSLLIHLPMHGYINDYIKLILMKATHIIKSIQICNKLCFKSSVQCFNKNDDSRCIHCSTDDDDCVIIHNDDLRRNFTLSMSSSTSSSQLMSTKPDDIDRDHHQSHPCYPWVLNQKLWEQSPLQGHRWPLQNEIVCCNNLSNDFSINEEDDKDEVEAEEERLRNPQWLGITWMHPEACRPNYLRILPIPFELVSSKLNNISDKYSPNGFELQCYLQYWDPFHHYNGSFITYCSFILSDSQINEYDLSKVNPFNQYGVVPSTVQTYQQVSNCQNNANVFGSTAGNISNSYVEKEKRKDSDSSDLLSSNLHFSDNNNTNNASVHTDNASNQPVSAIWRILVDLRIRPGSGIINPSINENFPIALADLTPMILIGAIHMNTVHYPNNCHHPLENSLIVRCQIPNITVSLVEHTQSEHDNIGGFELSRFCVDKVDFLYLSNMSSSMSVNCPSNDSIHFRADKHTLLTADVNWARLQQSIVGESFSCHALCNQNMNILYRSLSIFISSDRLISIGLLKQRLQKYTREYLSILEIMNRSRNELNISTCDNDDGNSISSNDHSPLGWTIVNNTNQSIILDQLPLIKYSSEEGGTPTISNSEVLNPVNSLFDISIKPRECVNWRPIVFPGPVSPAGHAFRIKLRIGINSTETTKKKTLIWSHPIDLPWPLLIRQQNSDILCALSLKWEETTKSNSKDDIEDEKDDAGIYYPEIYLIVCSPEPIGSPGKVSMLV